MATSLNLALILGVLYTGAADAQTIGNSSGIGSSAAGGSGIGSSIGNASTQTQTANWPPANWPPTLGAAGNQVPAAGGSSATATQQRAAEGSTSIGSVNADAVARTGNVGAATTIGGRDSGTVDGRIRSISGTGPESLYRIPRARVNVDLSAIRRAVALGPNATPDGAGN